MTNVSAELAPAVEKTALRASMIAYLGMGALGFGFAVQTGSDAILLDGVYSIVSFFSALLAGRVADLVGRDYSDRFHFGYAHFEPMVNALRGLLILGVCSLAFTGAVEALMTGGRPLNTGSAVVYGALSALVCLSLAWNQRRLSRRAASPLLLVDARNWFMDGMISLAVGLTFVLALILERVGQAGLVPYVDPVLVVALTLLLVHIPVRTVLENLREVLHIAPPRAIQDEVRAAVRQALDGVPVRDVRVRMQTIGRYFYVMVQVLLDPDEHVGRLAQLDEQREQIARALGEVPQRLILDVMFTADERWVSALDVRTLDGPAGQ